MNARHATAALKAAVAQPDVVCGHLFEAHMDDGTVYLTDLGHDLTWNGHAYLSAGQILSFEPIEESLDISTSQTTVTISGGDSDSIATFLGDDYMLRQWLIRTIVLDRSGQVIADPILIFDGRISRVTLREDLDSGESTIAIQLVNALILFERTAGRHTNDAEQQFRFPGDRGFEFVAALASTQAIPWGRSA
ncbi:MAG: DUF2163 domain-containing protein [Magnetococcales bacterium]|nr:DUF2163 domain-containing protein [Magnetococcales bacterium]